MSERTINGVRVVLRERFPAEYGWNLLKVVRRIEDKRRERISEAVGRTVTSDDLAKDADEIEDDIREAARAISIFDVVFDELAFEDAQLLVRGAVESWDFPGDPSAADCCAELDTIKEVMPLTSAAVNLFYTANSRERMSGEVDGGSTSPSEG